MSFEINLGTLIAAVLIYIAGVFLKPLILVLRDTAVWWWIENRLINCKMRALVRAYAKENGRAGERAFGGPMNFSEDPSTGDYVIDPQRSEAFYRHGLVTEIRLTKAQYIALEKINDERIRWTEKAELRVQKASNLYDLLVRHYSQPERPNPIEKILNTHREESYADTVEFVVSEIMDDPYQWRLERKQLRGDSAPP